MGKRTLKEQIPAFASVAGLLVLIAAYLIIGAIRDANVAYGLKAVVNQSVVVALVATGAVFIYTLGSFDISLGAATGVSALLGAMAYNATGSLVVMFLTCVGVALLIGFINSSLASVFNLPIFVTTVAMMSVLSAFMLILIGLNGAGDTIKVKAKAVRPLDNIPFKVAVLIAYVALCWFVFTLLPVGRQSKFIGGNPLCANLSGISAKRMAVVAAMISAVGIGVGGVFDHRVRAHAEQGRGLLHRHGRDHRHRVRRHAGVRRPALPHHRRRGGRVQHGVPHPDHDHAEPGQRLRPDDQGRHIPHRGVHRHGRPAGQAADKIRLSACCELASLPCPPTRATAAFAARPLSINVNAFWTFT